MTEKFSRCYGCMNLKNQPVCEHCGWDERRNNASHQLPVGTLLRNQYIIGRALGQGGFGITYLGWDQYLDIPVAIKEYYPTGIVSRETSVSTVVCCYDGEIGERYQKSKDRFMRESRMLARFSDMPEVVQVKSFFPENNTAYIVMEYVQGITMKEYVRRMGGRLSMERTLEMLRPVIQTLEKLHQEGIVHRDISPDNIMILPNGRMKLIDFGAVRDVSHADIDVPLSRSTEAILKQGFAPIEQYQNRGSLGPWTDVYALCATIYYCVTGHVLLDAPGRLLDSPELHLRQTVAMTAGQEQALNHGLELLPAKRIRSMAELEQGLYGATVGGTIPVDDGKTIPLDDGKTIPLDDGKTIPLDDGHTIPLDPNRPIPKWDETKPIQDVVQKEEKQKDNSAAWSEQMDQMEHAQKKRGIQIACIAVLLLAVVILFFGKKEDKVYTYTGDTFQFENVPAGYEARCNSTEDILVIVEGPKRLLEQVEKDDYTVVVDCSNTKKGINMDLPASVEDNDGKLRVKAFTRQKAQVVHLVEATQSSIQGSINDQQTTLIGDMNSQITSVVADNVLMEDVGGKEKVTSTPVLGSEYLRKQICSITFLDSLAAMPNDAWDVSANRNGSVMAWVEPEGELYALYIAANGKIKAPKNANGLFAYYNNVNSIAFNNCFDTSETVRMDTMFYATAGEKANMDTLDVSSIDTSKVTNMHSMFDGVMAKHIKVFGFDTANVTDMGSMFADCHMLEEIDLVLWNTYKVTDMSRMFMGCYQLRVVYPDHFDTTNVKDMTRMFYGVDKDKLEVEIVFGNLDVENVTAYEDFSHTDLEINGKPWREWFEPKSKSVSASNLLMGEGFITNGDDHSVFGSEYMRKQICSITFLDSLDSMPGDAWDVSQEKDGSVMAWVKPEGELYELYLAANGKIKAPRDANDLFACYINASSIEFNNCFDTSGTASMYYMFRRCLRIKTLDLSCFDTSNVYAMSYMFAACNALESVNLSSFDVSDIRYYQGFMPDGKLIDGKPWLQFFEPGATDFELRVELFKNGIDWENGEPIYIKSTGIGETDPLIDLLGGLSFTDVNVTSSNPSVATVNGQMMTCVSAGTTTIRVTYGNQQVSFTVRCDPD